MKKLLIICCQIYQNLEETAAGKKSWSSYMRMEICTNHGTLLRWRTATWDPRRNKLKLAERRESNLHQSSMVNLETPTRGRPILQRNEIFSIIFSVKQLAGTRDADLHEPPLYTLIQQVNLETTIKGGIFP